MMKDLTKVWKEKTGKDAIGEVSLGYMTDTYGDGCCDMCYSEVTEIKFYLLNNGERIEVYEEAVGITEVY